ncbi:hypothetical protein CE205_29035 [Achromobacter insolitus]|nr:hypothetical protein CE205_29035 [Achromobacter insolitus]
MQTVRRFRSTSPAPGDFPSIVVRSSFGTRVHRVTCQPLRPPETELAFFGAPSRDPIRRPYPFDKAWPDAKQAMGLKDFRFHDLRHKTVSRFMEAGLSDPELSAISGHKPMPTTHNRSIALP